MRRFAFSMFVIRFQASLHANAGTLGGSRRSYSAAESCVGVWRRVSSRGIWPSSSVWSVVALRARFLGFLDFFATGAAFFLADFFWFAMLAAAARLAFNAAPAFACAARCAAVVFLLFFVEAFFAGLLGLAELPASFLSLFFGLPALLTTFLSR